MAREEALNPGDPGSTQGDMSVAAASEISPTGPATPRRYVARRGISRPRHASVGGRTMAGPERSPDDSRAAESADAIARASRPSSDAATDVAQLVERCQRGEERAFRQLFSLCRGDVARIVHRMHGRREDFEDLVQETFVQIFRSISSFQGSARFSTWLYRVTVNVVLMHRRAAKSRPVLISEDSAAPPLDPGETPDASVARNRRVRAFRDIIDSLSEKKRTVYVLHEIEGVAPAEIARIVGAPVLTVRTRLFYARREVLAAMRKSAVLRAAAERHSDANAGEDER